MCLTEMATFSFYAGGLNTSPLIKQKHTALSSPFHEIFERRNERERKDFFGGMFKAWNGLIFLSVCCLWSHSSAVHVLALPSASQHWHHIPESLVTWHLWLSWLAQKIWQQKRLSKDFISRSSGQFCANRATAIGMNGTALTFSTTIVPEPSTSFK